MVHGHACAYLTLAGSQVDAVSVFIVDRGTIIGA